MMKRLPSLFAAVFILLLMLTAAYAAVPHLINYQGRLTDASGNPLTGSYDINFKIYDAETAGNLLWQETQTAVVVDKGLFGILLGSVTALNIPFDQPYFLEIKVGTEVMSPRQRITSAGYAIRAEVADSVPSIDPGMVGTKTVDEAGVGDGKILVYRALNGKLTYETPSPIFSPGNVIFARSDTIITTSSAGWTRYKEIYVGASGNITVSFDIKNQNPGYGGIQARIYVNGSPVGTQRTSTSSSYQTYTENIPFSAGDLVQLYINDTNIGFSIRNFRLKCSGFYGGYATYNNGTTVNESP